MQIYARIYDSRYIIKDAAVLAAATTSSSEIILAGFTDGTMEPSNKFSGANSCEYGTCTDSAWVALFGTNKIVKWGFQATPEVSSFQNYANQRARFTAVAVNGDQVWAVGYINDKPQGCGSCTAIGGDDVIRYIFSASSGSNSNRFLEGTSSDDRALGIRFSGQVHYVGGQSQGDWGNGNGNAGDWDIFLMKIAASGLAEWTVTYGSSAADEFGALEVHSSGDIYVAGNTKGSLQGSHNGGTYDYFLAKFQASDGARQWLLGFP